MDTLRIYGLGLGLIVDHNSYTTKPRGAALPFLGFGFLYIRAVIQEEKGLWNTGECVYVYIHMYNTYIYIHVWCPTWRILSEYHGTLPLLFTGSSNRIC